MTVRPEVRQFVEMGPLPAGESATDAADIARREVALHGIAGPVTDDEARMLVSCFGDDDCFGLAWTLLHLIETSKAALNGTLVEERPASTENEWVRDLWDRAHRG